MIENFTQLVEVAKKKGPRKLIVAAAEDDVVLEAVKMAVDQKNYRADSCWQRT